ncbi:alpha/beta hydrolase family protein [Marinagarivorans algicola]|uniref:alpha/beta hydrolase family protein n=1 Tax=Marinagarivorans algicola TaxID=1513270 RepID=UPI0006B51B0C|nr:prolyl oligopeptidase family serine peptidase [Marinagarivorans algicola]
MTQPKTVKPYGTWPSTLTANTLATGALRFSEPKWANSQTVLWPQSVPADGGRTTLMCVTVAPAQQSQTQIQIQTLSQRASSSISAPTSLLPSPWDVRSKAHEYGGGAFAVKDNHVFFVNAADQQIYRFDRQSASAPTAITQAPQCRYANLTLHPSGQWLFAVCEDLTQSQAAPAASIVAINLTHPKQYTLAQGQDFYAGLCIAPNGLKLAYITWQHPDMPWDNTTLWELDWQNNSLETITREYDASSASDQHSHTLQSLIKTTCIAGHKNNEAICQPAYSPSNVLHYVSDLHEWWNIYSSQNPQQPLVKLQADCATPQWTFGMQNWGFMSDSTLLISASQNGAWQLISADLLNKTHTTITTEQSVFSHIHCHNGQAVMLSAGLQQSTAPTLVNLNSHLNAATHASTARITPLIEAKPELPINDISQPQSHWFDTTDQQQAHLWYYPPTHSQYQAPAGTQPPLIVLGHGGPTGATEASFNSKIQYWTQRGFAVADVNYRGSTGFGRTYRHALIGQWGVKDVDDLCHAATYLANKGLAHPQQKIIKGSSAGGYSVLAALTMRNTFNAGVSLYGIADLETLTQDTHKFEAHYLDKLIGPYPAQKALYKARSPINHIDGLNCPILVAQGLDDKIVPPSQAQLIVEAAQKKGVAVKYLAFAGEAHGFRQPATLIALFEAEQQFYTETFNL